MQAKLQKLNHIKHYTAAFLHTQLNTTASKYLLFILLIQYLNFSDQSTCYLEQEDSIWTQGGIQRLVDRADQD